MSAIASAVPGFKFGADPELFIINDKGDPVCADGLIPGTKDAPYKVSGGAVQVDGFAAEFNIDPAESFNEFSTNIDKVLSSLGDMLPEGYSLSNRTTVEFSEEEWEKAPDNAKVLGCSPDVNAWTGDVNTPPDVNKLGRIRHLGGHLHVGWRKDGDPHTENHTKNCRELVQQLDWALGMWSVKMDPDTSRRAMAYGRAGACRYKPYGVEYRVLSPFWVFSPANRVNVWNRMQSAIRNMRQEFFPETKYEFNDTLIQNINDARWDVEFASTNFYPIEATL